MGTQDVTVIFQITGDQSVPVHSQKFLKKVQGNRFIAIHQLFDNTKINILYGNNTMTGDKVWAKWIIDPGYIAVIKSEA